MTTDLDLRRNTELLNAELPSPFFADHRYLRWIYAENPYGECIERNVDDDHGTRIAHYALIPQRYRDAVGAVPCAFSLNAVVRAGHQRDGHFSRIGLEIYEEAATRGWQWVVGVSNARSVGAVTKYMGWRTDGPLPVKIAVPLPRPTPEIEHHRVDAGFLAGATFDRLVGGLDEVPASGYTNCLDTEYLRWRLANPAARYSVHASPDLVAVSTRTKQRGIPFAVVMKLAPRSGRGGPVPSGRMISAICRHERAPAAVYAGFNANVPVRGIRPPRRFQPSPLYLILRNLAPGVDRDALRLDTFEFLDFDAY